MRLCGGVCGALLAGAALGAALLFAAERAAALAADIDGARVLSACDSDGSRSPQVFPPPNTLFVSIAAYHVPAREHFLFDVLDEYMERFERWRVDVVIDTNSAEFAARVRARYVARGGGINATSVRANVWSRTELRAAVQWGGSRHVAADLLLAGAHRAYAHHEAGAHAFFVYSEDDVLLTQRALELHAHSHAELWARGWTLALVRAEGDAPLLPDQPSGGGAALAALSVPSGARYVQLPSPYAALYILSAAQLARLSTTREWRQGSDVASFGPRERFAAGFHWTRSRDGDAFANRALTPILANGSLDPDAFVWHLPKNYAATPWWGAPRADAFWAADGADPLPIHATHIC